MIKLEGNYLTERESTTSSYCMTWPCSACERIIYSWFSPLTSLYRSNSWRSISDSVDAVSYSEYSECVQAVLHNLISRQESSSNQGLTMSTGASTVHDHATGSSSANTRSTDYLHQPISFSSTVSIFHMFESSHTTCM